MKVNPEKRLGHMTFVKCCFHYSVCKNYISTTVSDTVIHISFWFFRFVSLCLDAPMFLFGFPNCMCQYMYLIVL